jgi:hypothetical protein
MMLSIFRWPFVFGCIIATTEDILMPFDVLLQNTVALTMVQCCGELAGISATKG